MKYVLGAKQILGLFPLLALLLLNGCASPSSPENYLTHKGITLPSLNSTPHCHGYGCQFVSDAPLTTEDWAQIEGVFMPQPKTAQGEREKISTAIGLFERIIGAKTGTESDVYGTFQKLGSKQLDCVDESTNTTMYLLLLRQKGLLNFHTIRAPETRVPLLHKVTWPHQTALITDNESDINYVVDSWFHDNGFPAELRPLTQWKKGWKPKKHKQNPR